MTSEYVLAYVPRKMKAMGVDDNYQLTFRDLIIKKATSLEIDATGQFYYLIAGFSPDISITSESGVYDVSSAIVNEMQHEHTGKITIQNRGSSNLFLHFIVVIPNN
jgi:hypothetical protein